MNDDLSLSSPRPFPSPIADEPATQGMSSLYKLLEAFIALREKNERQHKLFEQTQTKTRDTLIGQFNNFVGETQKAFQTLRQEMSGEKRIALNCLSELLETGLELQHLVSSQPELPGGDEGEPSRLWAEAVAVQNRRVQAALQRHGIFRYDAVIGSPYVPALHERVGSKRMEGMDALRIAEQKEHGYASEHHDFVLRRPKVIVSE